MFTNYNMFCRFMDTKNLSLKQVCLAQNLSKYYFQIDYCQNKANEATNVLSCFLQRNKNKQEKL